MTTTTADMLVKAALKAREASYCPYSQFAVGAALLCEDGTLYSGANVEVSTHTPTVCAERVAFFRAVHEGKRKFTAIAVVGGGEGQEIDFLCPPCGVCRQVMSEFCDEGFLVITENSGLAESLVFSDILPKRFKINN